MKKLAGYAICIVSLCVIFTACYYISFKNALNRFNERAIERDSALLNSFDEYKKQLQMLTAQNQNPDNTQGSVSAGKKQEEVIVPGTKYILETYELTNNKLVREELNPTSELIGLNRGEVIKLLADYMVNLPIAEKNKGLFAYELLSFSAKEIVIRKSYNEDLVQFRFYVAVKEGKVIIYYSDLETVYDYTTIEAITLDEKDRNELMQGIYVKNEEELFSLLEGYSS